MIVYAGKQFWNDFNNWDEWVFQDANRPRDNDKFKLRPWLQSDKWDWRWTNKNIDFSHVMIKWWWVVWGSSAWTQLIWGIPPMKEERTESELSQFPSYAGVTPEWMKMEKQNNPFVLVKSWTIKYQTWDGGLWYTEKSVNTTYFEIAKSWLYYVMCYGIFYFDPSYYDSNVGYQYKERVGLAQKYEDGIFRNTDRTQARAVGNGDNVRFLQISWFPAWSQILPLVAHSLTSGTTTVFDSIAVIRLW